MGLRFILFYFDCFDWIDWIDFGWIDLFWLNWFILVELIYFDFDWFDCFDWIDCFDCFDWIDCFDCFDWIDLFWLILIDFDWIDWIDWFWLIWFILIYFDCFDWIDLFYFDFKHVLALLLLFFFRYLLPENSFQGSEIHRRLPEDSIVFQIVCKIRCMLYTISRLSEKKIGSPICCLWNLLCSDFFFFGANQWMFFSGRINRFFFLKKKTGANRYFLVGGEFFLWCRANRYFSPDNKRTNERKISYNIPDFGKVVEWDPWVEPKDLLIWSFEI